MSDVSNSEGELNLDNQDDNSWDDELWKDWQKIKEADDQLMVSFFKNNLDILPVLVTTIIQINSNFNRKI